MSGILSLHRGVGQDNNRGSHREKEKIIQWPMKKIVGKNQF